MKCIIAGSRDALYPYPSVIVAVGESGFDVTEVFEGGACGVDLAGWRWAREHDVPCRTFNAEWSKLGRAAGPIRNQAMIDAGAEALIAVWDGKSRGTADMIHRAERAGLKVYVHRTDRFLPSAASASESEGEGR